VPSWTVSDCKRATCGGGGFAADVRVGLTVDASELGDAFDVALRANLRAFVSGVSAGTGLVRSFVAGPTAGAVTDAFLIAAPE
jgi:hypothetical protein